jgi:phospholipid N-methyltransferase
MSQWKNTLTFMRQFRERFETTGSILPSSRSLARSMTRFLASRPDQRPVRVLEIGPGTGPVTNAILPLLRDSDSLELVELNGEFVRVLNERFDTEPAWQRARNLTRIHQTPLQDFQTGDLFDFVISGLPLNNFPADLVSTLTTAYLDLLKPGGRLSYFEYMYVRPVRKVVTRGADRERIVAIDRTLNELCRSHRVRRDSIWMNFPPAWVQHLQKPAAPT